MEAINLVRVSCPNCGSPIEEKQLKRKTIRCSSCNQTFQRNALIDKENDIQSQYLPPSLSDEDCKRVVIRDMVFTDNVPWDIFDTLKIEVQAKKLYPFYVFHLNWSADWSATFTKEVSHEEPKYDYQGRRDGTKTVYETLYRDANGTSAGDSLVVVGGSVQTDEVICLNKLCDFYNTNDLDYSGLFFTNVKVFDSELEGWNSIEVQSADDAYQYRKTEIKEFLRKDVRETVHCDADYMSSGWTIENCHFTYSYHRIKTPDCVFRPIWEMKCEYNNEPFGAAVDDNLQETFFHNVPQNESERQKIEELDDVINKDTMIVGAIGLLFVGLGLLFLILSNIIPPVGDDDIILTRIYQISFILAAPFLGIWLYRKITSENAKEEKKTILSNSIKKRKEAALRRFGDDPRLVEML